MRVAVAELNHPQILTKAGQPIILIPVKQDSARVSHVLEFFLGRNGPAREPRVVFRAQNAGELFPATRRLAWKQAYAVWKNSQENSLQRSASKGS